MGKQQKRTGLLLCAAIGILFLFPGFLSAQDPLKETIVSLEADGKPLHLILDDLTEQTGYYFTFDAGRIDSDEKKTLEVKDQSLGETLKLLLPGTDYSFTLIHRNIVITPGENVPQTDSLRSNAPVIRITGRVTDRNGRHPLPYATVGVYNTRFGTISNEQGEFRLVLPDTLRNPILAVSFIGYRTEYLPVETPALSPVSIRLEKQYISIQEVIIRHQDPLNLLSESLKRIEENYLEEPSGVIAYYRENVRRDEKILVFSEAVVEMARPGYRNAFGSNRVRLLKGRQIKSVAEEDTVLFRISSGINSMLSLDIMKNLPDFLDQGFPERYEFTFTDIVTYENRLAYVIGFQPRDFIDETLFRGEIYLDQETLALIAADFEYDPARIRNETEMFITRRSPGLKVRPVKTFYHVEYRKFGERYALSQVQGRVEFRVRRKRQWIASKYSISLEMAVTHVSPGHPPDIPIAERLQPRTILSEESFEYDPDFWGNYTTIAAESSLLESLENIGEAIQEISTLRE